MQFQVITLTVITSGGAMMIRKNTRYSLDSAALLDFNYIIDRTLEKRKRSLSFYFFSKHDLLIRGASKRTNAELHAP